MTDKKKFYQSKLFWLGVLEMVGPIATDYFHDVPNEVLVTSLITGLTTVLLRFATNKGVTR